MLPLDDALKLRYRYDPDTGQFYYRYGEGMVTNKPSGNGYIYLYTSTQNAGILAHRAAWFFVYAYWPKMLDHIDRCKTNNRIANLRETTLSENAKNSNALGVSFCKQTGKWRAYSVRDTNHKRKDFGRHETIEEALAARKVNL